MVNGRRAEIYTYMLLAGEAVGGRGEADDGPVAPLGGRQREEGVGHGLRQLRGLPEALLPQLRPGGRGGGEVVRGVVRHEVTQVHLVVGGGGGGG
jgi:hypothetical protein